MSPRILQRLPVYPPATSRFLRRGNLNPAISRRILSTTYLLRVEGDLGNPQSTSSEQSGIKTSRATDAANSPDTASVQTPVSNRSAIPGDQDEGTPTGDEMKRDPKEPAESKRKAVEKQGEKPLGIEDHQ